MCEYDNNCKLCIKIGYIFNIDIGDYSHDELSSYLYEDNSGSSQQNSSKYLLYNKRFSWNTTQKQFLNKHYNQYNHIGIHDINKNRINIIYTTLCNMNNNNNNNNIVTTKRIKNWFKNKREQQKMKK